MEEISEETVDKTLSPRFSKPNPENFKPSFDKPIPSVRCNGTVKNGPRKGEQCPRPSIRGGTVCREHGGAAPQTKEAAARRVEEARIRLMYGVEDAITVLEDLTKEGVPENVRFQSAKYLVDKGLGGPDLTVEVQHTSPSENIMKKLMGMHREKEQEQEEIVDLGESE